MTTNFNHKELSLVFGEDTIGDSPENRAQSSSALFVRSQIQLAPYSAAATGRQLSAREALRIFGWETLRQAVIEGSAPLVTSSKEPASTLRARRQELGLSIDEVVKKTKVSREKIISAETVGLKTPFRALETVAQFLALNDEVLGLTPNAGRDSNLGVRLREMSASGEYKGFTGNTVLQLSEAAWIIARQASLNDILADHVSRSYAQLPKHDSSFGYPAYEIGYRLAKKTRELLNLDDEAPIESVRQLIENHFGLPLIQIKMDERLAGATISNGSTRGIVINESGMNSNVWVRRMTMCHELGHLLWDPDTHLQRVSVDAYADIEMSDRDVVRDPPETRANAFAIAFLAPPAAIQKISSKHKETADVVSDVMKNYGISATAAKHHIKNITKRDTFKNRFNLPDPESHWVAMENLALDYFPIKAVSSSRRGRYAWYVAKSFEIGEISMDTAASSLGVEPESVSRESLLKICALWD